MRVEAFLKERAGAVAAELRLRIAAIPSAHPRLREAMLYSADAGGKRLRPALLTASYGVFGGEWRRVLRAAAAVEMVHTYSLIHDDLPALDDDALRRGRETNHIVYGEAMAILAGDALLTDAFSVLCSSGEGLKPADVLKAAGILARRAGAAGMVSGQAADLEAEGFLKKAGFDRAGAARLLDYIHLHKTADLITASVEMGAALAGAPAKDFAALSEFARLTGVCFQITDDILDVAGDKRKLGKSGSDRRNDKLTYPALYGLARSKAAAAELLAAALAALRRVRRPAAGTGPLAALARYVCERDK